MVRPYNVNVINQKQEHILSAEIRYIALESCSELLAEYHQRQLDILGKEESVRASMMRSVHRRHQFIAGRYLLRKLLCQIHGGELSDWLVSAGDTHKPIIISPKPVAFSLSHSGDWLVCVISSDVCAESICAESNSDISSLGVDIERNDRERDVMALMPLVMHPQEQQAFLLQTDADRQKNFTGIWSLKEAWLKQRGLALDISLMQDLLIRPTLPDCAQALQWQFADWPVVVSLAADRVDFSAVQWLSLRKPASASGYSLEWLGIYQ